MPSLLDEPEGPDDQPSALRQAAPARCPPKWRDEKQIASSHEIQIDPEFQSLISALAPEDVERLEERIKAEGCRDALVVWKHEKLLLDGHNRFEICRKHKIPYRFVEIEFPDRDAAKIWIIKNQLGRRNLNDFQRAELMLKMKPLIAAMAKANQGTRTHLYQNSDRSCQVHTNKELAELAHVSHDTIHKVRVITEKGDEALKEAARLGKLSISTAAEIAGLKKETQRQALSKDRATIRGIAKEARTKRGKGRRASKARRSADGNARAASERGPLDVIVRIFGTVPVPLDFRIKVGRRKLFFGGRPLPDEDWIKIARKKLSNVKAVISLIRKNETFDDFDALAALVLRAAEGGDIRYEIERESAQPEVASKTNPSEACIEEQPQHAKLIEDSAIDPAVATQAAIHV